MILFEANGPHLDQLLLVAEDIVETPEEVKQREYQVHLQKLDSARNEAYSLITDTNFLMQVSTHSQSLKHAARHIEEAYERVKILPAMPDIS